MADEKLDSPVSPPVSPLLQSFGITSKQLHNEIATLQSRIEACIDEAEKTLDKLIIEFGSPRNAPRWYKNPLVFTIASIIVMLVMSMIFLMK